MEKVENDQAIADFSIERSDVNKLESSVAHLRETVNSFSQNPDMHRLREATHLASLQIELLLDRLKPIVKLMFIA
jgi:hypothetical protein